MSRLYYEKQEQIGIMDRDAAPEPRTSTQNYLEKVSSIVPAEIVAGYLAMVGFLGKVKDEVFVENKTLLIGIFVFCLILTPIYIYYQAQKDKPKVIHMVMSSIAFVVWAFVTSGEKFNVDFYSAETASVILVAFSLVSGLIPMKK